MKKFLAILAVALMAALLCGQALAANGDITTKAVKAYADAEMTNYVGTIPAGTSLLVRSYDSYADVYVGRDKVVYIDASALLHSDTNAKYIATLVEGTKVYQRPTTEAKSIKLSRDGDVKICAVSGDWALVRSTGSKGVYAYVSVNLLTGIRVAGE